MRQSQVKEQYPNRIYYSVATSHRTLFKTELLTVAVDLYHPSCIQWLKSHLKLDGQCSATFLEEVSESTAGDWGQAED